MFPIVSAVSVPESGFFEEIVSEGLSLSVSGLVSALVPAFVSAEETEEAEEETIEEIEIPPEETEEEPETEEETESAPPPKETVGASYGPGSVSSAERAAIVAYAKQFLGGRYVYGGTDLESGVDCSGFTMRVYEHFGHSIGRTSRDQAGTGRKINASEAQMGDLFFYDSGGTINHVALYIGNGQVIHASSSTTGIIISSANYRTPCKVCSYLN